MDPMTIPEVTAALIDSLTVRAAPMATASWGILVKTAQAYGNLVFVGAGLMLAGVAGMIWGGFLAGGTTNESDMAPIPAVVGAGLIIAGFIMVCVNYLSLVCPECAALERLIP